jgi:hypothetical protein
MLSEYGTLVLSPLSTRVAPRNPKQQMRLTGVERGRAGALVFALVVVCDGTGPGNASGCSAVGVADVSGCSLPLLLSTASALMVRVALLLLLCHRC